MDAEALAQVVDPSFAASLATLDMEELRRRRGVAQEIEVALSYHRRIAQGRLDLVGVEQRRRRAGGARPVGDEALVAELTAALADRQRPPGVGRLPRLMSPAEVDTDLSELDAIAGTAVLSDLSVLGDEELASLVTELGAFERRTSEVRHTLHNRLDAIQAEITRRYRTGEATVDSLLS